MRLILTTILLLLSFCVFAQTATLSGVVTDAKGRPIPGADVFLKKISLTEKTNSRGEYQLSNIAYGSYSITIFQVNYKTVTKQLTIGAKQVTLNIEMPELDITLEKVTIKDKRTNKLGLTRLKSVDGMGIYAAKKSEVITLDNIAANVATNNSRQVYAKVAGLNIWESDGAGLQLGIGGRGLSPNRTSNFNTRQNGYDISADALGYPESYYTPPTEAVERIEIVRGAASLQYGTQFGGLLNFELKGAPDDQALEVTARQSVGSFGLSDSYLSLGGTKGKVSYFTFYQYKRGNGWRPNSGFDVHTTFGAVDYSPTERLTLGLEYTVMRYIAQQAGGLTDVLFAENPRQSIRERNWFKVNWNVLALTLDYKLTDQTKLNIRNFGLLASKDALGFLGLISRTDPMGERDLLKDNFKNFGNETRLLHRYYVGGKPAAFLGGVRVYSGFTHRQQGNANDGAGPDFDYLNPDDLENFDYNFPSFNVAAFAENVFNIGNKWSLTPGIRYEYINTQGEGYYKETATDFAGNVIFEETIPETIERKRSILLAGLGVSYKHSANIEVYGNFSQNYRAINFNDLRVANPNFVVDENLTDEKGFNADLGIRGTYKNWLSYDASLFLLQYDDRIGLVFQTDSVLFNVYRFRTNVSDARNVGIETFVEVDFLRLFSPAQSDHSLSLFTNLALIDAQYIHTDEAAIKGKKVELVPPITLKSGLTYRWRDLQAAYQFSYTGKHFTDATNAELTSTAVNGIVPAYYIMDFSLNYTYRWLRFEAGINNLSNNMYYTRRAAGYPGPGIIPADGRSFYVGVQVKM